MLKCWWYGDDDAAAGGGEEEEQEEEEEDDDIYLDTYASQPIREMYLVWAKKYYHENRAKQIGHPVFYSKGQLPLLDMLHLNIKPSDYPRERTQFLQPPHRMHEQDWPTGRTGTNHVAGQFHTVTATSMWMCFQCYLSFSKPESFWQPSETLGFCGSKTSMAWAKRSRTLSHCLTASFWRYAAGLHLQRSEIGNSKKCPESCKASTIHNPVFSHWKEKGLVGWLNDSQQ